MADRYTYLPLIGIFVMMVWGGADIATRLKLGKHTMALFGIVLLILLMSAAHFQVQTWRDSKTLYGHALEVTGKNYLAYSNLAAVYIDEGRIGLARKNLQEAIKIKPHYSTAHYNLGVCLYEQGRLDEAQPHFEEAIRQNPSYADALFALGDTLLLKRDYQGAASRYRDALSLIPRNANAHNNLGIALMGLGRSREAAFHFREALLYDPAQESAKANLDKISKIVNTSDH
jgi:Tfp pilus assembly protein PilF